MNEDFNPFDLTPKKPIAEENKEEKTQEQVKQKVVVRRVSLGPLLHSRIVKLFVLLASMFIVGFASYAAMEWWLLYR